MPDALSAAGVRVVLHHTLFPEGADDVAWLKALADQPDLIVLTKDSRIRRRPLEREAMQASRLRVFRVVGRESAGR